MANVMALTAELFLSNYEGIAGAFDRNYSLEVTFKVKLAQEKDSVEVSYKPVETYKDSASANLPEEDDSNQSSFDFEEKAPSEEGGEVVDVEESPKGLPAPMEALPAPEEAEQQED